MSDEEKENSLENSNDSTFVDFSDLDEQVKNENKEKKETIQKEVEAEKESAKTIESKANDKLAEALEEKPVASKIKTKKVTEPISDQPVEKETIQTPKKESKIVLESDHEEETKIDAETPIADETADVPSEEEERLMNSIDPKSRMHRVITEGEKEETKDDFIID